MINHKHIIQVTITSSWHAESSGCCTNNHHIVLNTLFWCLYNIGIFGDERNKPAVVTTMSYVDNIYCLLMLICLLLTILHFIFFLSHLHIFLKPFVFPIKLYVILTVSSFTRKCKNDTRIFFYIDLLDILFCVFITWFYATKIARNFSEVFTFTFICKYMALPAHMLSAQHIAFFVCLLYIYFYLSNLVFGLFACLSGESWDFLCHIYHFVD